ncbi:hypothetical protein PVAND_007748 [Polypedilum vanderplanki]|uniref:CXXC-type domain-containing protein n=1 Tax=Polypedilum vanderplanki TaxID=319348 RepID=A0A9J6C7M7_POLVA|nr:hypothetical protein PVAND_007748 [Polypedilum vanderplanki]
MMSAAAPQTTSTTTDDPSESGLPAFTTFQATELENTWEYYDRSVIAHQNNDLSASVNSYTRPWEMESKDQPQQIHHVQHRGFEPFPKLPSFQSQFHSFADNNLVPEPSLPSQVTAVPVPISPSSASPSNGALTQLTQLTTTPLTPLQSSLTTLPPSNFHTLAAVNVNAPRGYPLVPAPIQARDIPTIQQQYIDERHIQLYQPITTTATFHHPAPPQPLQSSVVTVLKNESVNFDLKNGLHHHPHITHHNASFQNATLMDTSNSSSYMDTSNVSTPKTSNKTNGMNGNTPNGKETRKKERRKIRASSLESSTESDASSAMDIDGANGVAQVAAVSSTDHFKSPMHPSAENGDRSGNGEKQQKQKKRKRCGECIGCAKKDNCGECAPCRNDKSHQICKQRRCEKLTEKKDEKLPVWSNYCFIDIVLEKSRKLFKFLEEISYSDATHGVD